MSLIVGVVSNCLEYTEFNGTRQCKFLREDCMSEWKQEIQKAVRDRESGEMCLVRIPPYLEVKDFCREFSFIKETTLRWQIYSKDSLGISDVFVRPFGQRKILVDVEKYFALMSEKTV